MAVDAEMTGSRNLMVETTIRLRYPMPYIEIRGQRLALCSVYAKSWNQIWLFTATNDLGMGPKCYHCWQFPHPMDFKQMSVKCTVTVSGEGPSVVECPAFPKVQVKI